MDLARWAGKMPGSAFFLLLIALMLVGCDLPAREIQPAAPGLATRVAATLSALTPALTATPEPTSTAAPTPTPAAGRVSGKVCYRDKTVIQLNVFFQATGSSAKPVMVAVSEPEETYALDLPTGQYRVYAWSPDFTVGVLPDAGLSLNLNSAVLNKFDICDYAKEVPYPPGFSPAAGPGSISGRLTGYPGSSKAQYTVVAFNLSTGYWYYVILMPGELDFTFSDLDAGRYQVVAYDGLGQAGGTAPNVYVIAGQATNIGISSWGGSYPENPVK